MNWKAEPTRFTPEALAPKLVYKQKPFSRTLAEIWGGMPPDRGGNPPPGPPGDLSRPLLTGGSGMIGTRLASLLASDPAVETVTILSRRPHLVYEMCDRLIGPGRGRALRETGKVRLVPADMSRDDGVATLTREAMGSSHVFNLAARVHAMDAHTRLQRENADAVAKLAGTCLPLGIPLTHASTLSVFVSSHMGGEDAEESLRKAPKRTIYGGYAQSKALAESIVESGQEAGLDARIVRFGLIVPEFAGYFPNDHFLRIFLRTVADMGTVPEWAEEALVDLTPADQAAQALAAIARSGHRGTFHYANPESATLSQFVNGVDAYLREDGPGLETVPVREWEEQLAGRAKMTRALLTSAFSKTYFLMHMAGDRPILNVDVFQSTARQFAIDRALAAGAPRPKPPRLQVPDLVDAALSEGQAEEKGA